MNVDPERRRTQIGALALMSVGLVMVFAAVLSHTPLVIYNASESAPIGFYWVDDRRPQRGDMAVVRPPPLIESIIVARAVLPPGVPLVKQVTAVGGDEVCRSAGVITINGKVAAEALDQDSRNRPLPKWEGCLRLIEGEFFLLQPHPFSFDSRYFGPISRCDIIGVARPIWTWNPR